MLSLCKKMVQNNGYRVFGYVDCHTNKRYVSFGSKALINKLQISRATLYNRVKADGWYADNDCIIFYIEKKDILHDIPKNNNIEKINRQRHLKDKDKTEPNGAVKDSKKQPKSKSVKPNKDTTERNSVGVGLKVLDGTEGEQGGSQSSDHEKVPTVPLPSNKNKVSPPIDLGLQAKFAEVVKNRKNDEVKKEPVKVVEGINEDLLV